MTNVPVKNTLFAIASLTIGVVLSLGAFATTANAEGGEIIDYGGGGWSDFTTYDGGWSDFTTYDGGWSDASTYDYGWSDFTTYDGGWSDAYEYNAGWQDAYEYDAGWSDAYEYDAGWQDAYEYNPGWEDAYEYNPGYTETYEYNPGYTETYEYNPGYTEQYAEVYDEYIEQYQQAAASYMPQQIAQKFPQYTSFIPSYTPQKPTYIPPTPSYPVPPVYPPVYPPQPPVYPPQPPVIIPPAPQQPNITNTNVNTNVNTCTGGSCNTVIDNSINGSFNTATTLHPVTPQPIIQYQIPQYPQPVPQQGLYCVITVQNGTVQNGQAAILSWTSYGATSATLSDGIGMVPVNGTLPVRPDAPRTYTLTVYGPGGVASCNVFVNVIGQPPYVSLSQIPYTGIDMGPLGTALYILGMMGFAAAAAYLLVYYKGGALALMTETVRGFQRPAMAAVVAAPAAPSEEHTVDAMAYLPVTAAHRTTDSMAIAHDESGTPRLVITRA